MKNLLAPPESPQPVPIVPCAGRECCSDVPLCPPSAAPAHRRPLPVRASAHEPRRVKAAQVDGVGLQGRACLGLDRCGRLEAPHGRRDCASVGNHFSSKLVEPSFGYVLCEYVSDSLRFVDFAIHRKILPLHVRNYRTILHSLLQCWIDFQIK